MGDTRLLRHVVIFFDVFIAICGAQLQSQYRIDDPSTFRVDVPNVGSVNVTLSLTTQRQTTPTQARPVQPLK